MDITSAEISGKLHGILNDAIDSLKATKNHLESFQKNLEAAVVVQLKNAKYDLKQKKQRAKEAMSMIEKIREARKKETVETVAEWKAKHYQKELENRAKRAEDYAETCATLASYYAVETELAILEAVAARQDAREAMTKSV